MPKLRPKQYIMTANVPRERRNTFCEVLVGTKVGGEDARREGDEGAAGDEIPSASSREEALGIERFRAPPVETTERECKAPITRRFRTRAHRKLMAGSLKRPS